MSKQTDTKTDPALFVQQIKYSQRAFDEIDALLVVAEFDPVPSQLLSDVLLLLQMEDVLERRKEKYI